MVIIVPNNLSGQSTPLLLFLQYYSEEYQFTLQTRKFKPLRVTISGSACDVTTASSLQRIVLQCPIGEQKGKSFIQREYLCSKSTFGNARVLH